MRRQTSAAVCLAAGGPGTSAPRISPRSHWAPPPLRRHERRLMVQCLFLLAAQAANLACQAAALRTLRSINRQALRHETARTPGCTAA